MVEICSFVASYLFVAERRRVYCSVQESGASIRDEQTWGARYLFAGVVSYVFIVDFVRKKLIQKFYSFVVLKSKPWS